MNPAEEWRDATTPDFETKGDSPSSSAAGRLGNLILKGSSEPSNSPIARLSNCQSGHRAQDPEDGGHREERSRHQDRILGPGRGLVESKRLGGVKNHDGPGESSRDWEKLGGVSRPGRRRAGQDDLVPRGDELAAAKIDNEALKRKYEAREAAKEPQLQKFQEAAKKASEDLSARTTQFQADTEAMLKKEE